MSPPSNKQLLCGGASFNLGFNDPVWSQVPGDLSFPKNVVAGHRVGAVTTGLRAWCAERVGAAGRTGPGPQASMGGRRCRGLSSGGLTLLCPLTV